MQHKLGVRANRSNIRLKTRTYPRFREYFIDFEINDLRRRKCLIRQPLCFLWRHPNFGNLVAAEKCP